MKEMSWYAADSDEPARVPTRAPSIRRIAVVSGGIAVAASAWAIATDVWAPFLILGPILLLGGPVPWRRFFYETRTGYAALGFIFGGVWFGVFESMTRDRHAVYGGLLFGLFMGVAYGITWEKTRKQPGRFGRWLQLVRPPWKPS